MSILDRYLFRAVASATLVATLVLVLLELFISLLVELQGVGKGNYSFTAAIYYLLLIQPQRLYTLFPMALLVGSLLGMGALASNSELTVMRAAGLSLMRLTTAVIGTGLILSLGVVLLGEFIAPPLKQFASQQRALARGENLDIRGGRGFWVRDQDYFIHVQAVLPGVRLANIHIFKLNDNAELQAATAAETAYHAQESWILERVQRSIINDNAVYAEKLPSIAINSAVNPQILEVLAVDPDELAIRELWMYIGYLEGNGLDAQSYRLVFWRKVLAPFSYIAMLIVAMPFAFSPQRKSGVGQRWLIGLLLGLMFFLSNYALGNVVLLYGYPAFLGAILPSLLFIVAGFYALQRLR